MKTRIAKVCGIGFGTICGYWFSYQARPLVGFWWSIAVCMIVAALVSAVVTTYIVKED